MPSFPGFITVITVRGATSAKATHFSDRTHTIYYRVHFLTCRVKAGTRPSPCLTAGSSCDSVLVCLGLQLANESVPSHTRLKFAALGRTPQTPFGFSAASSLWQAESEYLIRCPRRRPRLAPSCSFFPSLHFYIFLIGCIAEIAYRADFACRAGFA